MPTPVEFLQQYRNLTVTAPIEDLRARVSRLGTFCIQLRKYFMMDWTAGAEELSDYNVVTRGSRHDAWFQANKDRIRTAAMGKGAPQDYVLALEWAVRSGKVRNPDQTALQTWCDEHLGIDCSGFVTNYLIACGKKSYSTDTVRNTSAASYFSPVRAVNDVHDIRRGDLLVWMNGNAVKRDPGHVAVVDSYVPVSAEGGNMRVVEATGADGATPKILSSMYSVERIVPKGGPVPAMILVVRRFNRSGHRVAVIRV